MLAAAIPDSPDRQAPHESVGWRLMVAIVLSSLMGVGVLISPTDFQRLGWLPGLALLLLFASSSAYSGLLLARLFAQMPWATTLYELASVFNLWGPILTSLVYASAYAAPLVFQLVCRSALMQVLGVSDHEETFLTPVRAGFVVVLLLSPTSFAENLGEMGWLSTVGSSSMAAAMAALCMKLLFIEPRPPAGAETYYVAPTDLNTKLIGVLDLLFIFGGQANWGRFIESMAGQRKLFAYSASVASSLLLLVATAVASVGYSCLGGHLDVGRSIVDSLRPDGWTKIINAGVFVGIYVMDAIQINVCTQLLLEAMLPRMFKPVIHGHTVGGQMVNRHAPYKLTRKLAVYRQRREAAEEDDCAVAGAGARDASSSDKGERLAKVRDAGITHKPSVKGAELTEPLLHPRPLEEDLLPTHIPRQSPHTASGIASSVGSAGSWQITVRDQEQHQTQRHPPQAPPSCEPQPEGSSLHANQESGDAQEMGATTEGQPLEQATLGQNEQGEARSGVSGLPEEGTSEGQEIALYSEDERGFDRQRLLQARQAEQTRKPSLPDAAEATRRALLKRILWACTSFTFMCLYWLLSLALPFVPELMALIAALGAVTAMLLLPCSLALKLLRLHKSEQIICFVGCLLSVALSIAGCFAAVMEMNDSLGG